MNNLDNLHGNDFLQDGNTLIIEAIERGRSLSEIRYILEDLTVGKAILDRNSV